mgnify:CR=1 FL=1
MRVYSPRGGNRKTVLLRPCNTLLDIQANRQELQRDLAQVGELLGETPYFVLILQHLYALAALIERPVQARLEAERARLEGR